MNFSLSDADQSRLRELLVIWREDPVRMVRELFRVEPDQWQIESLSKFPGQMVRRQADQACAGVGKSADLAWKGWNFILCYAEPDQHPNGAVVSITGDNLKNGLWKELAVWYNRAPLLQRFFEMTSEKIFHRDHPQTWFIAARSFSKSANPEEQGRTLSGLHAPFMLYLLDETGDMHPSVLRAAEQGINNCRWGKICIAGNPTSHEGLLYHAVARQSHLWDVTVITGDPDDSRRSQRVDMEWAREQINLYGRDNPWVMAYILGKFPPSSINALLGPDDVYAAMKRGLREEQFIHVQKRLGIDVARFGDDTNSMFPRQGLMSWAPDRSKGLRSHELAARVIRVKNHHNTETEFIDSTGGWAAGVEDACLMAGVTLIPINFSGKADDPRFFNKRSEMIFRAAENVKRGAVLPDMPGLVRQATAATYWFENGKLRVEEKAQIKARIGESPDDWDAYCLTYALPDMPSSVGEFALAGVGARSRFTSEYDPFASDRE